MNWNQLLSIAYELVFGIIFFIGGGVGQLVAGEEINSFIDRNIGYK